MSKVEEESLSATAPVDRAAAQSLLVTAAGGVVTSGLIAMLASAEALAARMLTSANQASELYALRNLAMISAGARANPRPASRQVTDERTIISASLPAGAPVVT